MVQSPVGTLSVAVDDGVLRSIHFGGQVVAHAASGPRSQASGLQRVIARLRAYFDGDIKAFDGVRVDPQGTSFQRDVWRALMKIPAGRTCSYSELARAIGRPDAVRAVGAANGANPIPIVIPCHRVIGADGRLVGYGGGLERKQWLLAHEGVRLL
jgi:methylated-DNA-[protein]-cysteine S-methyltransferase